MKNLEHEIRDLLSGKEQLDEQSTASNVARGAIKGATGGISPEKEKELEDMRKAAFASLKKKFRSIKPELEKAEKKLEAKKPEISAKIKKEVKTQKEAEKKALETTAGKVGYGAGLLGTGAAAIGAKGAAKAAKGVKDIFRRGLGTRSANRSNIKLFGRKWAKRLGLLGIAGAGLLNLIRNMGVYGGTGDSGGAIQTPGTATQLHHIAAETEYNLPLIEAVEPSNETRKNYNAGTEERKKIENVARPTKNKLDRLKGQMSKQGEIKTKIIDESAPGNPGFDIPLHDIYTGMKHKTGIKADFKHNPDTGSIRIFKRGVPERTWAGFFKGEKTPETPHLDFESEEHANEAGWEPYDEAVEPLKETRKNYNAVTEERKETDREKIYVVPRAENDLDTANRKRFILENIKKKIIDDEFNIRQEFNNFLIEENIELTEEEYDEAFDILFQYFVQDLNENIGSNLYTGAKKTLEFGVKRVLAPAFYASDAYENYKKGDTRGALTSGAKAVASLTPIGAATSLAHDAYEARKDIAGVAKQGYDYARKSIFGKPKPSNQISQNKRKPSGLPGTRIT